MSAITFQATVYKVTTLVDMGLRITFDLPEDAVMQAAQLMECKRAGVVLEVVSTILDKPKDLTQLDIKSNEGVSYGNGENETDQRAKKRTTRVGRRRSEV